MSPSSPAPLRTTASLPPPSEALAEAAPSTSPGALDRQDNGRDTGRGQLARMVSNLSRTDGVLACGLVDLVHDTLLLAAELPKRGQAEPDGVDLAALTRALCAARRAHMAVAGAADLPDEVLITSGNRQGLLRRLPGPVALGFVARLDRTQANLALLRFRLLDMGSPTQG